MFLVVEKEVLEVFMPQDEQCKQRRKTLQMRKALHGYLV